ncbi:MAG: hypothetical protein ACRELY_28495 [Polyangiaceae bacterium]
MIAVAIGALLTVPGTHAVVRAYDLLFKSGPNPAMIIWSLHFAMFWRLGTGAYVAGVTLVPLTLAAKRDLAGTLKILYVGVFVAMAIIVVQGVLMP